MTGNLTKIQKGMIKLTNQLNGTKKLIKHQHKNQKERILSLESELEKREFYAQALEESRLRLIEEIREERIIFEQELELNIRYSENHEEGNK